LTVAGPDRPAVEIVETTAGWIWLPQSSSIADYQLEIQRARNVINREIERLVEGAQGEQSPAFRCGTLDPIQA
jgi:phenylpropionate dioxygenase-like ring-hydroxylating dioxygenase large terminal subunit